MIEKIDEIACLETYTILTNLKLFNQLPNDIQEYINKNKSNKYIFIFNKNVPIQLQTTNKETMVFLSYLYLKYFNKDNDKKNILKKIYIGNEYKNKKQALNLQSVNDKSNIKNDIFENKMEKVECQNVALLEVKKEKWYIKLFKKIFKR